MSSFWLAGSRALPLDATLVMGVLNVTPDSFSDGGEYATVESAVARGLALVEAGAGIVDVGGESTRPGAEPVTADREIARVVPVVAELAAQGVTVSIDTMKHDVARAALQSGASIINDVGGLRDPQMVALAASSGAGVVVMHMRGMPRTMQADPRYGDVVAEVCEFLASAAGNAVALGVKPESIVVDPGIGFGKTLEHNLEILRRLEEFTALGYPVMVGTSRKAFLGALTGKDVPSDRDLATAITVALAVERGVSIVRVHDPVSAREAATVARAIVWGSS